MWRRVYIGLHFKPFGFLESKTEAHKHIVRNRGYALDLRALPYQVSLKHFPSLAKVVHNHRPLQRTAEPSAESRERSADGTKTLVAPLFKTHLFG